MTDADETPPLALGVIARAPIPGACKRRLLAAHSPEWVAGLYAAMLRDTLDGLLIVPARDYVVFAACSSGEEPAALEVLARHVPLPWRLVALEAPSLEERVLAATNALLARASCAVLVAGDAPSALTEPLAGVAARAAAGERFAVLGPSSGDAWALGASGLATTPLRLVRDLPWRTPALADAIRARCNDLELALHELPDAPVAREPSDVLALLDELRRHPERAPRTAHYLTTRG